MKHLSSRSVQLGIMDGSLYQGVLRMNYHNYQEAVVMTQTGDIKKFSSF